MSLFVCYSSVVVQTKIIHTKNLKYMSQLELWLACFTHGAAELCFLLVQLQLELLTPQMTKNMFICEYLKYHKVSYLMN